MLLGISPASAQIFNERDFLGKWVRTESMQPVDDYLLSIDSLGFGNRVWTYIDEDGESEEAYASGFFSGRWKDEKPNDMSSFNSTVLTGFSITHSTGGEMLHIIKG